MAKSTDCRLIRPDARAALTRRHWEVFEFICSSLLESGAAPSGEEIARHLGVKSTRSVARLVRDLAAGGVIVLRRGKPRSAVPVGRNAIAVALPDRLERAVRIIAERARTTPEAVVVEAVHQRLSGISDALAPPASPPPRK